MQNVDYLKPWLEYINSHVQVLGIGLQNTFLGHALWQYLAYLFWVVFASLIAFKVVSLLDQMLSRFLEKKHENFSAKLIERMFFPLKVILAVAIIISGFRLFEVGRRTVAFQQQVLILACGVCAILAFVRLAEVFLWRWKMRYKLRHNDNLNAQLFMMIEQGIKFFIVVTFSMMTLHNLGVNITSLLASLSIGSLAVALAAQDTLANLFGAVSILADNTFKIGDSIKIGSDEGTVELIGLRSTRIRNSEGHIVMIPNKNISTSVITNITERKNRKTVFNFYLPYETNVEIVEKSCQLLRNVFEQEKHTENLIIHFSKITESFLVIEAVHWSRVPSDRSYREMVHEINLTIKKTFDLEGINFVHPTPTVFIEKKD